MFASENHALLVSRFFLFTVSATTPIYTLSLHDALPIYSGQPSRRRRSDASVLRKTPGAASAKTPSLASDGVRSEEHTSELQSLRHLVCRLLLEKKKKYS